MAEGRFQSEHIGVTGLGRGRIPTEVSVLFSYLLSYMNNVD